MNYIFDIDGTLTPSRLKIDPDFEKFFLEWMKGKNVYLVTGSDRDKTIEQVGEMIWNNCTRAYQSCGNAVYEGGELIRQSDFKMDSELQRMLYTFLATSEWKETYNNHIEERIGLVNFSSIGRECPQEARERYYQWDKEIRERELFCTIIEKTFTHLEATIGGQISIDIYPKGQNKSQVLNEIPGPIKFFGDRCTPGGNDYPVVERLYRLNEENNLSCTVHEVKDWRETWNILKRN